MRRKASAVGFPTALLAVCLALAGPLHAADLRNVLANYSVSSWTEKDGLASNVIWSIAQDADGYLWLATEAGLLQFDGVRFVSRDTTQGTKLPKRSPRVLFVSRDKSIWVGYDTPGGVARIRAGEVREFGEREGIGRGVVTTLIEDAGGTMWAGTTAALYRFDGRLWQKWNPGHGLPEGGIYAAHAGKTLLVGTASGVFRLGQADTDFRRVEAAGGITHAISEDSRGSIWLTDPVTGFRKLGERTRQAPSAEQGRGLHLLHDSKGNLWVATSGQGLWRVRSDPGLHPPSIEKATTMTGLLSDGLSALLEDREGNIWVATRDGLNRLTPHKAIALTDLGLVDRVEASADGGAWVGTVEELVGFPQGRLGAAPIRQRLAGGRLRAMHAGPNGSLWVATDTGLFRGRAGTLVPVDLPARYWPYRFGAMTSDDRGDLWLYDLDEGLFRLHGSQVQPFAVPAELRRLDIASLHGDREGRIWILFAAGQVGVIERDGGFRSLGPESGLDAGAYQSIYEARNGAIWLGASDGLSRFDNGRFATLSRFPVKSLRSIVEDDSGSLWLGTYSGIMRMDPGEFDKAIASSSYQIRYSLYEKSDGLAGRPIPYGGATRTKDGRLWFVTSRGVTIMDPASLRLRTPPDEAPVRIEGALADQQEIGAVPKTVLPPRTARLEIDYTVLNLSSALRTRFRYRLEGFDADWIDGGTHRQAFYTNLPPGTYRFRVVANSNAGTWAESGAEWEFAIAPTFYQTAGFNAGAIALLALSIWIAWRLHLVQVRKRFAVLLAERARLSREIHDTLLQSLVGVALECDAMANDGDAPVSALRRNIVEMRKGVEEYIREARQSIWDLRSPKLPGRDLAAALGEIGERASAGTSVEFSFNTGGPATQCSDNVEEQLLRIGREAVLNAMRHAQPAHIRMELHYSEGWAILRVADDGRGFDPECCMAHEGCGHYGLMAMKERAESVGGSFTITSRVRGGTDVEARVPICPQ